jgi:hypothetical protein
MKRKIKMKNPIDVKITTVEAESVLKILGTHMAEEARCYYCGEEFNPNFNLYHYDTGIWFCSQECDRKQDEKTRRENPDMFPDWLNKEKEK